MRKKHGYADIKGVAFDDIHFLYLGSVFSFRLLRIEKRTIS